MSTLSLESFKQEWARADQNKKVALLNSVLDAPDRQDYLVYLRDTYAGWNKIFEFMTVLRRTELFNTAPSSEPPSIIASYYYLTNGGGIESSIRNMAGVVDSMHKSYVIVTDHAESPIANETRIDLESYLNRGIDRLAAFEQIVSEHNIDTLLYHAWCDVNAVWDILACKLAGARVVFNVHGVFSHFLDVNDGAYGEWNDGRLFTIAPLLAQLSDAVVSQSKANKLFFKRFNSHSFEIRHAVASNIAQGCTWEDSSDCSVLWVGRIMDPYKHFKKALLIFAIVKSLHPNAKLIALGGTESDAQMSGFTELADKLGISDSVSYMGFVNPEPYYRSSTALLSTTEIEGYCMVLAEAYCAGIPVVGFDLPYLPYANCPEVTFSPQGDIEHCAAVLNDVLSSQEKRSRMSAAEIEFAHAELQPSSADTWKDLFETLPCKKQDVDAGEMMVWDVLFNHYLNGCERTYQNISGIREAAEQAQRQNQQPEQSIFGKARSLIRHAVN